MNICHLIITYKNPEQLARLVKTLTFPGCDIYVHVDKKIDIKPFEEIKEKVSFKFIKKRVKVNWGGFSLIEAIIASLEEIKEGGKQYDFINLMSGQDYPVKTISSFAGFLEKNKGKCFISYEDIEEQPWWNENLVRITKYHFNDFSIKGKYLAQRVVNSLISERKFPLNWKLYGGNCSSWWTLPQEAAYFFAETIRSNNELRKFAKLTWAPDEYLYATVLMNSKFKDDVVNNNYRFIDWTEGNANPKLLKSEDFQALTHTNHFFARKFDTTVDAKILDELDALL